MGLAGIQELSAEEAKLEKKEKEIASPKIQDIHIELEH